MFGLLTIVRNWSIKHTIHPFVFLLNFPILPCYHTDSKSKRTMCIIQNVHCNEVIIQKMKWNNNTISTAHYESHTTDCFTDRSGYAKIMTIWHQKTKTFQFSKKRAVCEKFGFFRVILACFCHIVKLLTKVCIKPIDCFIAAKFLILFWLLT